MRVSVIIPAFNEAATIETVVERVVRADIGPLERELILVDDGSRDGTGEIMRRLAERLASAMRVQVLSLPTNAGKGTALRAGIAAVCGDFVVFQDADLEYSPDDYAVLLKPLVEGKADAVFGSRFTGGEHRVLYFWHELGNRAVTLFSNVFTNYNCSDIETGAKAFRAAVLRDLGLRGRRFEIEPEIVMRLARRRCRLYEVSVSYAGRTYAEGKKITWRDGVRAIYWIVRFWLD